MSQFGQLQPFAVPTQIAPRRTLGHLCLGALGKWSVSAALERVVGELGVPASINVDHGTEFMSKAFEEWVWQRGIKLEYIRPGKPNQDAHIESLNGRLRDACLKVTQFTFLDDVRCKIEAWRQDYNHT